MTLEDKIEYLGKDKFVKFKNTEEFEQLSPDLAMVLKEHGVLSDSRRYPYILTDGKLNLYEDGYIQFAYTNMLKNPICFDIKNDFSIVLFSLLQNRIILLNSSLTAYIGCMYSQYFVTKEYILQDVFGKYLEDDNSEQYAAKLKEMLELEEPGIENFELWADLLEEMEAGII